MSSLSDAIALSSQVQANREYRERLEKELKELWESGNEEEKQFARRVMELRDKLI